MVKDSHPPMYNFHPKPFIMYEPTEVSSAFIIRTARKNTKLTNGLEFFSLPKGKNVAHNETFLV
jgi:hypothetical protein